MACASPISALRAVRSRTSGYECIALGLRTQPESWFEVLTFECEVGSALVLAFWARFLLRRNDGMGEVSRSSTLAL